ncbi:MAG: GIY-YIG nuclease family protein [Bacteroidetes bacterium]|nr:GIY-YIG nuclease family protein [Bacteroidota bacterium]
MGPGFESQRDHNKVVSNGNLFCFMRFFNYILYLEKSHDQFYIGQTNNIEQRLQQHNSGYEKSTAPYRPYEMVWFKEQESRSAAIILERKLKI